VSGMNLIDDAEFLNRLSKFTSPVGDKELQEYVHYDHIPVLREASQKLGLFILLRRTNPHSVKYIGYQGFVPKPLQCKPKTAKSDAVVRLMDGRSIKSSCAGLVVDPAKVGVSAFCYDHGVYSDAMREWKKYWSNGLPTGFAIQENPESGYYGCVMRCTHGTRVYPHSRHPASFRQAQSVRSSIIEQSGPAGFQLLPDRNIDRHALSGLPRGCSYIHGDYDLYALIDKDDPSNRISKEGKFSGIAHTHSPVWRRFEAFVRSKIQLDMIQHGSQEHFKPHTNEVVDIFCPTRAKNLWHVKVDGKKAIKRLYASLFDGRQVHQG
jgi:hypothetical protein